MGIPRIGEDYTELRAELARILPEGVGYAVLDPRLPRPGQLYPVEAAAMTRAVPKRVNEFTAGRVAARQAMAMIGLNPAAIPMGDDRAPIWPQGVTGSISHCESACVAVAARTSTIPAIGIDVEENTPLDRDLWNEICRPEEMAWLMDQPEKMRGRLAKRVFSAKEAVYKAVYPQERRVLGFGEVVLESYGPAKVRARSSTNSLRRSVLLEVPHVTCGIWQMTISTRIGGLCS